MISSVKQRTTAQLQEHYLIEQQLASRLRQAPKAERRGLYNTVYDERIQRIPDHPLTIQATDRAVQLRAIIPQLRLLQPFIKPFSVFLEIGPGDCALAMKVAKRVKKVYAVDVSYSLLRDTVHPENFQLCLSDGIEIPVPSASVDVAYSNQMMEHLHPEDAQDQLLNIYTALAPGGKYICITPNRLSGPWDISRHFDETATGLHLKEYTITELAQIFRSAGFSKVHVFLSYMGYKLSPMLPVFPITWLELGLERMPRGLRKKIAYLLTAVKVVGTK